MLISPWMTNPCWKKYPNVAIKYSTNINCLRTHPTQHSIFPISHRQPKHHEAEHIPDTLTTQLFIYYNFQYYYFNIFLLITKLSFIIYIFISKSINQKFYTLKLSNYHFPIPIQTLFMLLWKFDFFKVGIWSSGMILA